MLWEASLAGCESRCQREPGDQLRVSAVLQAESIRTQIEEVAEGRLGKGGCRRHNQV